ncbi:MAG: hypothetical protein VCE12_11960, partial [Candidatus Latescibacterota bacterium]
KCAEEWGDDFKMQKCCQDKQFEALADLRSRTMANGPYAAIRKNCSEQWGTDYKMRDYCEKKQVEALRELNCLTPTIAPHQTLKPLSTQLTEIAIYFVPDEIAAVFHCHLTRSS